MEVVQAAALSQPLQGLIKWQTNAVLAQHQSELLRHRRRLVTDHLIHGLSKTQARAQARGQCSRHIR